MAKGNEGLPSPPRPELLAQLGDDRAGRLLRPHVIVKCHDRPASAHSSAAQSRAAVASRSSMSAFIIPRRIDDKRPYDFASDVDTPYIDPSGTDIPSAIAAANARIRPLSTASISSVVDDGRSVRAAGSAS
jgi:hypothetical protein